MGECMAKDSWYNSIITDCEKCDITKCQDNGDCLMQCNGNRTCSSLFNDSEFAEFVP